MTEDFVKSFATVKIKDFPKHFGLRDDDKKVDAKMDNLGISELLDF